MINTLQLLTGIILALLVALAARKAHALNNSGALAAFVLGSVVFGLGGLGWAVLLMGFFISSSALSRFAQKRKETLSEKFSKGSERDAGQVAANGAIAGCLVILHLFFPQSVLPWAAFAGAMAAVNADTWATELGVLSRSQPRLISNGRLVERGSSGGVTIEGTLAALSGALFIALLALPFGTGQVAAIRWMGAVGLGGLLASLVDSLLGATVQAIYTCPACGKETERHPLHTCGSNTVFKRGWRWMNNDWVNTFCALSGALLASLFVL
jgi:uncharacterized protein (TIGR00297 family)